MKRFLLIHGPEAEKVYQSNDLKIIAQYADDEFAVLIDTQNETVLDAEGEYKIEELPEKQK